MFINAILNQIFKFTILKLCVAKQVNHACLLYESKLDLKARRKICAAFGKGNLAERT